MLQQLKQHRATRFGQLIYIYFFLSSSALIYNLVLFFVANGHPLLVVTSGVTLSGFVLIFYWHFRGKLWLATYLCVPYMLVHAVASVCCYRGWLAPGLTLSNKNIFDFQILVNFIIINALPLIEIRFTIFGMVPILFVSTYMQVLV